MTIAYTWNPHANKPALTATILLSIVAFLTIYDVSDYEVQSKLFTHCFLITSIPKPPGFSPSPNAGISLSD